MERPNYQQIRDDYLPNLKPFEHHNGNYRSMSASRLRDKDGTSVYYVWSYTTPILELSLNKNGNVDKVTYYDDSKYSRTTSRQQGIIRYVFWDKLKEGGWIDKER